LRGFKTEILDTETKQVLKIDKEGRPPKAQMIIIFSATGFGKTSCEERIKQSFKAKGYTIIELDVKEEMEACFAQFEPEESYHLKRLRDQHEDKETLQALAEVNPKAQMMLENATYPVKIYHPFTFSIPHEKIPEQIFYTIPLKSLHDSEIQFLIGEAKENQSFKLLSKAIRELKDDESLAHLLHKVMDMTERQTRIIGGEEIRLPDSDRYSIRGTTTGTIQTADDVGSIMDIFIRHGFLSSMNDELNLDWVKILKDNKHLHLFSQRYLDGEKEKYFNRLWIINQIRRHQKFVKRPILLIVSELGVLCPKKPVGYVKVFSAYFQRTVRTVRTQKISIMSDAQTISVIDENAFKLFTEGFFGNAGLENLDAYAQAYKIPRETLEDMKELESGEYVWNRKPYAGIIKMNMPLHMHKEEGVEFDSVMARLAPERMINYSELIKKRKEIEKEIKAHFKELAEKEIARLEDAEKKRRIEREKLSNVKTAVAEMQSKVITTKKAEIERRNNIVKDLYDSGITSSRKISAELEKYGYKLGHVQVSTILKEFKMATEQKKEDTPAKQE